MKRLTTEWVRKAEADFLIASRIRGSDPPLHDGVCFHCQQLCEKYLKALLEESSLHVPKTHDLLDLLDLVQPHYTAVSSLRRGLDFLTDFAVDPRYPGLFASKRQAEAAFRWAKRVREAARDLLGIRKTRGRR